MLSEDYFGFANQRKFPAHKKVSRRTELSEDRLSSTSRNKSQYNDKGIQQLKKKYEQINKKTKKKEKSSKHKKSHGGFANYHSLKMRYLHYNDEGGPNNYDEIQRRTEFRAMEALQRNQSVSSSHKSPVVIELKNNSQHLRGIIKAVIRDKNSYSQTERIMTSFKNKYTESMDSSVSSSVRSSTSHRVLRKLDASEKFQMQIQSKYTDRKSLEENKPIKSNLQVNSGISYCILGMNTLRKDNPIPSDIGKKSIIHPTGHIPQAKPEDKNSAASFPEYHKGETSQISINSKKQDDQSQNQDQDHCTINQGSQLKIREDLLLTSNSGIRNNNLVTSDYERIKILERKAKESRVRILKAQQQSLKGSVSLYGNNNVAEHSSLLPSSSHRVHSDGSSISNMIYASSKLFDEKRKRNNGNDSGEFTNSLRYVDSFMKIHAVQKTRKEQMESNFPLQQSFMLKDTFGNAGAEKEKIYNPHFPGEYYKQGYQISPGPSQMLLRSPASPKIYSNSRIIYNQSNVSPNGSSMAPVHSAYAPAANKQHNMSPPPQFKALSDSSDGILNTNSSKKEGHSENNSYNISRNPVPQQVMSPIKESLALSGSYDNQDMVATGKFNLAKSMRLWNSFEDQVIAEHYKDQQEDENIKAIKQKLDIHMSTINWIADFIEDTEQFYADGQNVQFQLCSFLLYKKFYEERVKVVRCLRKEFPVEECFRLTDKEIKKEQLGGPQEAKKLHSFCKDLENCNVLIWSSVQQLYEETKKHYYNNSLVHLNPLKREDIGEIFDMLYSEIHLIIPKISDMEGNNWDSFERDQSYSIICWRSFRIMELVFLLSELEGRKIKKFEEEIETDYFEYYVKLHFGAFQECVFYFRSN